MNILVHPYYTQENKNSFSGGRKVAGRSGLTLTLLLAWWSRPLVKESCWCYRLLFRKKINDQGLQEKKLVAPII